MIDSAIVRLSRVLIFFLRNDRERGAVQYFAPPSSSESAKRGIGLLVQFFNNFHRDQHLRAFQGTNGALNERSATS
jgi:hypothetical protein